MLAARIARLAHRWLALLIGLQLVLWSASGVYMTAMDIDLVRGDPLVRNLSPPLALDRVGVGPAAVAARHPGADSVVLRASALDGAPYYEVRGLPGGTVRIDAGTGLARPPPGAAEIAALARAYYAGTAPLRRVERIERDPPGEIGGAALPLWRAEFGDRLATTLYLDAATGRLVTRRHRLWRWFDFLWSLHIMDYEERTDVNNALLRTATVIGAAFALSGLWLIAFAFRWGRRRGARR